MDVIYTYGGGHILYQVFNAIAALCQSDSPYWTSFMIPALMVGGIWAAVTATAQANFGVFTRQWFLPTYVLLSFALVPKTSINIVDEVDPSFGYDRVDNIPIGLALVASTSSSLSRGLTELLEDTFATKDLTRFTKTGFAFSSRLTQEARTLRIKDSRIRQNVKDWADQCVWLPYLKTNIKGKGESARKSEDLLSWVESNGHPSLGIYWRNEDGSKEYKTCRVAVGDIRRVMDVEGSKGMLSLVGRLFGFTPKDHNADYLRPLMQDAWQMISKSTRDASHQVQQMMIVNAQKEAFDDAREKFNYPRLHPELVSLSAARNLESQGMAGFMKYVSSSTSMPLLQAFMVALLSVLFFLVVPFCFMPGGVKIFLHWMKLMFSIQMWPVFSTILNALSLMLMERSAVTVMDGSIGFSIATTSGLADAAWNVAGWSAGMQLMVPLLAWGFVSGGQFAITQIMQNATGGLDAGATRMASEAADGNLSMGNLNLMNETIASRGVAQQSHAMNANFASTLNTGSEVITQTALGDSFFDQKASTLRENFSSSGSLSASVGESLRDSQQLTEQKGHNFNKAVSDTSSTLLSFADKLSTGTSMTDGVSQSEQSSIQKTADETKSLANDLSKKHGISAQTAVEAALKGSIGVGGLGAKISASTGTSSSATNIESIDKAMNSHEGKRLTENLGKLTQFAQDHRGQLINSSGKDMAESLNSTMSKAQSSAESYGRSWTQTKNWEKMQSLTEQNSVGTSSNDNDAWIDYVAARSGNSKADAVSLLNQGGSDIEGYKSEFLSEKQAGLRSLVEGSNHELSDREIQSYLAQTPGINETSRGDVQQKIDATGFKTEQQLTGDMDVYQKRSAESFRDTGNKIQEAHGAVDQTHQTHQGEHDHKQSQFNYTRMGEKISGDTQASLNSSEPENPLEGASKGVSTQAQPKEGPKIKDVNQRELNKRDLGNIKGGNQT